MPIVKFTQDFITNGLICSDGKRQVQYCDSELRGLLAEARANQKATYYLRYKNSAGKTSYKRIGNTTSISLVDARKAARLLKLEVANGNDPSAEEKARKAVLTLNEFWTEYYFPFAKSTKRSWKRDEQLFRIRIQPKFGHLRLNQITRQQIQSFHTGLRAENLSFSSCDHHAKLLKRMYNLALRWEFIDKTPAASVELYHADNRVENSLDDKQLEQLMKVLLTDQNRPVCLIAMFLLSTGARLNEALQAKWSQIDRQQRLWRLPSSNSKNKKIGSIPLNDSAIDILNQLDTEKEFEYLFVNRKCGGKPFVNIHKTWSRLRKDAGLPRLRLHDLRHALATMMINSGRTLYEVQQVLRHSSSKVTERYSHLSSTKLQQSVNSASVIINRAMKSAVTPATTEAP